MTSRLAFQDRTSLAMLALLAVLLLLGTVFSIAAPQFLSAQNHLWVLIKKLNSMKFMQSNATPIMEKHH